MTEESDRSSSSPGATAGDAAPTQAIPRIPKPAAGTPAQSAKKNPPAKNATSSSTSSKDSAVTETDKGRPRRSPAASNSAPKPSTPTSPAGKAPAAKPAQSGSGQSGSAASAPAGRRPVESPGGPVGRPLTAADYARTTKGSPATTSVIPAVKDAPSSSSAKKGSSSTTLTPNPAGSGRRASLRLTHVEPWSVTRLAFAISVAMMIVSVVAVAIFWGVLNAVGVWDQINDSFTTVLSDDSASFNVTDYFGFGRVVGLTLVLSAVNVIVMTALATIAAHLYNLAAQLMGGVELTFAEER